jgi:hypothetical protein
VSAQELKSVTDKWRSCVDSAAVRYSKSAESAPVVAHLAALSCVAAKKEVWDVVSQQDSPSFADNYVEAIEKHYLDRVAVNVIEMRLR